MRHSLWHTLCWRLSLTASPSSPLLWLPRFYSLSGYFSHLLFRVQCRSTSLPRCQCLFHFGLFGPTLVMFYSSTGTFITSENLGRLTLPSADHLVSRRTALLREVATEISISVSATSRVRTACSTSAYLGRDKSVLLTTSAIPGPTITTGTGPVGVSPRQALPSFHPRFSLVRHLVDWWFYEGVRRIPLLYRRRRSRRHSLLHCQGSLRFDRNLTYSARRTCFPAV